MSVERCKAIVLVPDTVVVGRESREMVRMAGLLVRSRVLNDRSRRDRTLSVGETATEAIVVKADKMISNEAGQNVSLSGCTATCSHHTAFLAQVHSEKRAATNILA
jgi:hypothetical protein